MQTPTPEAKKRGPVGDDLPRLLIFSRTSMSAASWSLPVRVHTGRHLSPGSRTYLLIT